MNYLKLFENHSQYEEYKESGLVMPIISHCINEVEIHYNQVTPSHDFVEIGGIKWATMNVGANSVTDYGLHFQWGDTQGYTASQVGSGSGQKYFYWDDYKYWASETSSGESGLTKYNDEDGKTVLEPSDDAVTAAWGGNWRMPTSDEFQALSGAVNAVWATNYQGSGINGLVCTDKNDSSKVLFFLATGRASRGSLIDVGNYGFYWGSSLYSGNIGDAYVLRFSNNDVDWDNDYDRYYGFPMRGVLGD